jgi:hypothetical protein
MNEPDIIPQLKHCQDEVDDALRRQDIEELKKIFKREGIPWLEFDPNGKYKPDIWYGSCNPDDSDAPMFSSLPQS